MPPGHPESLVCKVLIVAVRAQSDKAATGSGQLSCIDCGGWSSQLPGRQGSFLCVSKNMTVAVCRKHTQKYQVNQQDNWIKHKTGGASYIFRQNRVDGHQKTVSSSEQDPTAMNLERIYS